MGEVFPEIRKQQGLVTNVIRKKKKLLFAYTGSRVQLLDNVIATNRKEVPGAKAFELYDTFFPSI
jgi:alanyl-tRNA synthetase